MIILGTNSIKDTGFNVDNSVRLDGSSSYMTKSMGTPTNIDKYSFSFWVKRSKLGVQQSIFRSTNGAASNDSHVTFQADDTLRFEEYGGSASIGKLQTTQVFRDISAWYSILLVYDSGNGTAGNRMRMYVNGTEVTAFGTDNNPSQNADSYFNRSGETLSFGRTPYSGGGNYFSGYVAELVMCDGQALTPTDIGEFDEDSGIFKPINVSGLTFGNNGFYLDFEDSSNLGNDANGGTDLTESNLTATDQTTDTCTNNFATLNPLQTDHSGNTSFSEGNNKFQATTGDWVGTASTQGTNTGKWYAEFKLSTLTTSALIGVATDVYMSDRGVTDFVGFTSGLSNYAYAKYLTGVVDANEGKIRDQSQTYNSYGSNTGGSTGDIIGVALDLDNNKLYFSVNGTWENSGDPAGNSNGYTIGAGTYQFGVWGYQSTSEANFGNPSFTISSGNTDANGYGNFEYAVPSGYFSLNTKNLAEYG